MREAREEMLQSLNESVIDKVKEIASKKSAKKIDGVMVDSFTASAISQIYDKVNDANKKKMEKLPITKLADLAFKMMQKNEFVPEEVDLDEASARADARRSMRADPDMRQMFSKDVSATDDDVKGASKNIMMQMRKAVSLRSFDVEFADGKKVKIPQKVAQSVLQKYNSFRKPADKEKYQAKVGKSYKDMLAALKEGFASDAQRRAAFARGYKAKGKKDKKESTLERMNKKIQEKKNG